MSLLTTNHYIDFNPYIDHGCGCDTKQGGPLIDLFHFGDNFMWTVSGFKLAQCFLHTHK